MRTEAIYSVCLQQGSQPPSLEFGRDSKAGDQECFTVTKGKASGVPTGQCWREEAGAGLTGRQSSHMIGSEGIFGLLCWVPSWMWDNK